MVGLDENGCEIIWLATNLKPCQFLLGNSVFILVHKVILLGLCMEISGVNKCGVKRSGMKKLYVYEQLQALCPTVTYPPPQYEVWLKTREIADKCDISVYSARLYLLKLEQEGKVLCSHKCINNSLRWYPVSQGVIDV